MKVFISWSGERSRLLAQALRDWLPTVIQAVEPMLSKADIHKGTMWGVELSSMLEQSRVGIICLTPDNLTKPWILFEAGVLSKFLTGSHVCPLLFNLEPTDIDGPLAQFQATIVEKEDLRELVRTINFAQGEEALNPELLDRTFELSWPVLERQLSNIPDVPLNERYERSTNAMVREILERIRANQRESESKEGEFNKSRDSMMTFILKLFQTGFQGGSTLPPEIAGDFENWSLHTSSFLKRPDISSCPDCLGTGLMIVSGKTARRCEHKALNSLNDTREERNENADS
ncbi:MAG TPA: TIR domain-containing protein [Pyrinomonadaceae bacterium]